jgi:hypothetical protein
MYDKIELLFKYIPEVYNDTGYWEPIDVNLTKLGARVAIKRHIKKMNNKREVVYETEA